MDPIYREEQQRLDWTKEKFHEIIEETNRTIERLPYVYRTAHAEDMDTLNDLLLQAHNRIAKLNLGMGKPYFARIDFTGEEGRQELYLGKIGVMDDQEQMVTLDWRAPVATLYYDSNVGEVEYESPSGRIRGTLDLKRQLEIEEGELVACRDVDTVANDDLLRPYLGVNADNRLKNIIASIQSEQNRIIRERLNKNIVVQGVAGSGKTTVALHRIAYLVYNHRDEIQAGQYLVIGPNRFFINYISSVLPDLDVDSVPQYTFEELAREILGEEFQLNDPAQRLSKVVGGSYHSSVEKLKTSLAYRDALDRFLAWYEPSILPEEDFCLRGFPVLSHQEVREAWDSAQAAAGSTVRARVEQCVIYLTVLVDNRKILLDNRMSEHFRARYRHGDASDLDQLHKDRVYIEKELDSGCRKSLRQHFGRLETRILALYRLFLQECPRFLDPGFGEAEALQKQTLACVRKRKLDAEDLSALLYLRERIQGAEGCKGYRHAVIDEAQDFGEFEFYVLQRLLSNCTFTVVGDLAQSLYSHRSIDNWQQVLERSFEKGAELCEMHTCYRTTVEIMEAANHVTETLGLAPAVPVIRHGKPVGLHPVKAKERAQAIAAAVEEYREEGLESVAILAKTERELASLCPALKELGLDPEVITSSTSQYSGGLCAMTGYLSKGLEFDGVILCDVAEKVYSPQRRIDMHLLYVAMTRPLHRLDLFHTGPLPSPLQALAG